MNLQVLEPIQEEELILYEYCVLAGRDGDRFEHLPCIPQIGELFHSVKGQWIIEQVNDGIKEAMEQGVHKLYDMTKNEFHSAVFQKQIDLHIEEPSNDVIITNLSRFLTRRFVSYIDYDSSVTNSPVANIW